MGMTDAQYKGILLDQLKEWQETRKLAEKSNDIDVIKKSDEQIEIIRKKLEF